jgi:ketosteroid isomerase-like protein
MAMTEQTINRRTALAAIGAIGMLPISNGKADDESPLRGPYKIEDWGKTWRKPNKARVLARVPAIATPDIAGYWPQTTRPVRGPHEYAKRIIDLLDFIPDLSAEPIEVATNGDVMFVRWIARGTGPKGRFEAVGVDRLIAPTATWRRI